MLFFLLVVILAAGSSTQAMFVEETSEPKNQNLRKTEKRRKSVPRSLSTSIGNPRSLFERKKPVTLASQSPGLSDQPSGSSTESSTNSPKNFSQENCSLQAIAETGNCDIFYITQQKIAASRTYLMDAIFKKDILTACEMIKSLDANKINHQDLYGNTALHYAVLFLLKPIVKELLKNPLTNCAIWNKKNYNPQNMLVFITAENREHEGQIRKIKHMLFERASFDFAIMKYIKENEILFLEETDLIENVKDFHEETLKQAIPLIMLRVSKDFPGVLEMPNFIDEEFILTMMSARIGDLYLKNNVLTNSLN